MGSSGECLIWLFRVLEKETLEDGDKENWGDKQVDLKK